MNKKKTKIALFSLAFCLAGALCTPLLVHDANQTAYAATVTDGLKEKYSYNSTFIVPTVTIDTPEGEVACSKAKVIFPDGKCYTGSTLILSQCGEYTILYDTGKYQTTNTFNVLDENWVVSSSASSVEYVEEFDFGRYTAANGFPLRMDNGKGGISVDLAAGDTFTYNVPVNIYDGDNLFDVIKCYPEVADTANAKTRANYVTVKLIDCYDANRYLEFVWWIADNGTSVCASVGSHKSVPVGLEYNAVDGYKNQTFNFEGGYYVYHDIDYQATVPQYGTSLGSLGIVNDNNLMYHGAMNFQYDTFSQKVYTSYTTPKKDAEGNVIDEVLGYRRLITDLDATELYESRGKESFDGFTTGECYLSIQTYKTAGSNIRIDIESIFGRTGEELKAGDYVDKTPPVIQFKDGNTYDKPMYVQKDVPVVLPEVEVKEVNAKNSYTTTVYANYGTDYQVQVATKNNTFVPNSNATYAAVYKATDNYGNTSEQVIRFVVSGQKVISYVENKPAAFQAGVVNALPDIEATSMNGEVVVRATVKDPLGKETELDENFEYAPNYLGDYLVTYEITDGISTAVFSYEISCANADGVVFKEAFYIEKYFLKGATYSLQEYYAYKASASGLEAYKCTAWVSVDGEAYAQLSEADMRNFVVTADSSLDFKFECEGVYSQVYHVDVVDANYNTQKMAAADYAKYFLNENATFSVNATAFHFAFDGSKKEETISYVNPLALSRFSMSFTLPTEKTEDGNVTLSNFTKLEIKLIDYYDPSISVSAVYEETKKGFTYSVGDSTAVFDGEFLKNLNESVSILNGQLYNSKRGAFDLPAFKGNLCYLEITVSGISGKAGISVKEISGQKFVRSISPTDCIQTVDNIKGAFNQYDTFTINPVQITNVLYPITASSIKVDMIAPNGKAAVSNGVTLSNAPNGKYDVKLDQIGKYALYYKVEKPDGSVETFPYVVIVNDAIAPNVQFEDGFNEDTLVTVKKGSIYTAQSFTVSDNYSAKDKITTTILYTTDKGENISHTGNKVTFVNTGYYRVTVVAQDEAGNATLAYYNVLVVE